MQTFSPTFDNATERELNGFAALITAIEDGSIDEGTLVVNFNGRSGGGFGTIALFQYFVLQTGCCGLHLLAQGVSSQEGFTFLFGLLTLELCFLLLCFNLRLFETTEGCVSKLHRNLAVHHLGIVIQTIDETLLDEVELGLHAIEAHEPYRFLLANRITDILRGSYHLRVSHLLLEALVEACDELISVLTGGVVRQEIIADLSAVHQTEGIVERVVLVLELNLFRLGGALGDNRFAGRFFSGLHGRVFRHDIALCCALVHDGSIRVKGVDDTLEEGLAVVCPSGVTSQTFFLEHRYGGAELTTRLSDVAEYLVFVEVCVLEGVNELGDSFL